MSRNATVGLAVVLCMAAAGLGAFFATRPGTARQSSPDAGVVASETQVQAGEGTLPAALTATEGVIGEEPVVSESVAAVQAESVPTLPAAKTTQGRKKPSSSAAGQAETSTSTPASTPALPDSTWTGLEKPWPSGTATNDSPAAVPAAAVEQPETTVEAVQATEPAPVPEPQFEELVVTPDSVLGLKLDSTVNSETARVEDPVEAHVTREVRVGARVAIPEGSRVIGSVSQVEQGGKMKTRARLGVKFHTLVLADGTRTPIQTDAVFREGDSPGQEAAGKVGAAAAGGAILGAIFGGRKGAVIGGSIGAAGGTAAVMAGKRNPAVLLAGTSVTVRLLQPVSIMVDR